MAKPAPSAEELEWNEFQSELSRKALDVLNTKLAAFDRGEVDKPQLRLIVDCLFDTISGLAPWDVTDAIYAVRKELGL